MSETAPKAHRTIHTYDPVQIDRGIPIPSKATSREPMLPSNRRPFNVAWSDMQIGDSVFLAGFVTHGGGKGKKTFLSASVKRLWGGAWVSRLLVEDGVSGVRVWRMG